jgi:erythromycin esterase-like protein
MALAEALHPLTEPGARYDSLLERAADKRFVLLGEASHGTHEFYRERAEITKRLIAEHGFTAVAAEADWPDAYPSRRSAFVAAPGPPRRRHADATA